MADQWAERLFHVARIFLRFLTSGSSEGIIRVSSAVIFVARIGGRPSCARNDVLGKDINDVHMLGEYSIFRETLK